MTTTIKENGCLIITAETEIESYALQKWYGHWPKFDGKGPHIGIETLSTKNEDDKNKSN